ncbi:MAG: beta-glucosidase [Candidatus Eisenbacteria bacterium RBG_16_71_46]|nr:MAG: beta-glucosidase [Candidatus Eisenbacteria bacterium RBG_16_71_46]
MADRSFPDGFLWGVATSAQQIEGGSSQGGRGESIWDRFAATPGRIADGSDARVACDHYHRWREDVGLLKWLGVGAYRFSIAWPRIVPGGRGAINASGLDFYDALVDALLAAGVLPFVTLNHWDLPQPLQDRGGWGARATAEAFVEYAGAVSARLGDRVRHWATHNEPWCIATLGHEQGEHAPGHRDPAEALRVAHHLLLSHGWAVETLRRAAPGAEVGIVLIVVPGWPARPSEADREAVRRFDGALNRWYLDPLFRGRYPADAIADRVRLGHLAGPDLPFVREGDLEAIATPLDFLGVNYYCRAVLRADAAGDPVAVPVTPEQEPTDMGWEVFPQGLHDVLVRLAREYRPAKIYVTENGAAYTDAADATGRIADLRRIEYIDSHLAQAHRAIAAGVPLGGYFAWSLLDNFEWARGYAMRFGLFDVDFATQRRRPRDSAHWYRRVVAAGAVDDLTQQPLLRRIP